MEEKKKSKKELIVIVVIFSILIIVLGSYICYDKIINNKRDNKQIENNSNNNNQIEKNTNKNEEKDNNSFEEVENDSKINDNNTNNNSASVDFDLEELSSTLHSSVQNDGITTFVSKCVEIKTNENYPPSTEINNNPVSNTTIDTIINKLKTAKNIKKTTFSWFGCPPKSITYYVSVNSSNKSEVHSQRVFSLNYADGNDILLVGYNNEGYAFHFNSSEEINGFIESLK